MLRLEGGGARQDLQTCARMKEHTERIQNHIGFAGSFRRSPELRASEVIIGNCFKTLSLNSKANYRTFICNTYGLRLQPFASKPSDGMSPWTLYDSESSQWDLSKSSCNLSDSKGVTHFTGWKRRRVVDRTTSSDVIIFLFIRKISTSWMLKLDLSSPCSMEPYGLRN